MLGCAREAFPGWTAPAPLGPPARSIAPLTAAPPHPTPCRTPCRGSHDIPSPTSWSDPRGPKAQSPDAGTEPRAGQPPRPFLCVTGPQGHLGLCVTRTTPGIRVSPGWPPATQPHRLGPAVTSCAVAVSVFPGSPPVREEGVWPVTSVRPAELGGQDCGTQGWGAGRGPSQGGWGLLLRRLRAGPGLG